MSTHFHYRFVYSGGITDENGRFISDPPQIYITKNGYDYILLLMQPEPVVEFPDCKDDHWELPNEARGLIAVLQKHKSMLALFSE